MNRFILTSLLIGATSSLVSASTAVLCARLERRNATAPINAISHIATGDTPPARAGRNAVNAWTGFALHTGASVFWAAMFEALHRSTGGRRVVQNSTLTAVTAYITDYYVVSKRFRPGYEVYLSRRSMLAVYASLAAGFAIGSALFNRARPRGRVAQPGFTTIR